MLPFRLSNRKGTNLASRLDGLRAQMAEIRAHIEAEFAAKQAELRYSFQRGRAVFDAETSAAHRAAREGAVEFLRQTRLLHLLTAPFIYSLIVPFALLDLFVTVYQAVCFPVYHIEKVHRTDHILIDRRFLAYLNLMQKLNCIYCSYCNGPISYVREIAARTEAYWCPIKHSQRMKGTHDHHAGFVDYGDADAWRERLAQQRVAGRRK